MNQSVKTTEIKKKYKDKKTGEYKEITINHAKVKDRILAFWENNPHGKIETSSKRDGDTITFKTFILADKSDEFSKEATGHSYGTIGDEKAFEKLETISVGRALALLGYASSGEIASGEEMEEFLEYQKTQKEEGIQAIIERLDSMTTVEELREYYKTVRGNGKEVDAFAMEKANLLKAKAK